MEIIYPQTLVLLWKYEHGMDVGDFNAEEAWLSVIDVLKRSLPNQKDKYDDVMFCLTTLLQDSSAPTCIRSRYSLIAKARQILARENNPVQYELDDILREALLKLEEQGVIERDEASKGHRISKSTLFAFKGTSTTKKASLEDYEKNKHTVQQFSSKIRGNSPEHTRILAPADALKLVEQLLKSFGGWVQKTDLLKVIKNHIPEQLTVVSLSGDSNEGLNLLENLPAEGEDDFIDEFDRLQAANIANSASNRIWERICAISDKVFCLYYLPGLSDNNVSMKDIGNTSTVSDQNKKISTIVKDELKNYKDYNNSYKASAVEAALNKILANLFGKCTESGYNTPLYSNEVLL